MGLQRGNGGSHMQFQVSFLLYVAVSAPLSDLLCSRHYAEFSGYFETVDFIPQVLASSDSVFHFYDSNTGKRLFTVPVNRSLGEFLGESRAHGWPSFRDDEVNWDVVRCLEDGETVSVDGTHLGHNLPDEKGSRYCINLVSVAGKPADGEE